MWKEAIAIIDCYKDLINGALSVPLGSAVYKVCGLWI